MAHVLSVYDRLRPHLAAEDLLGRLGIEIVRRMGSEAYCKPLCHQSESGESLQVNLHTGRWNCKACQSNGVFGDLIQLVEYVQTGGRAPTHQAQQKHSTTHREALRWLCEQFAIPFETHRVEGDPALDVVHMFAMAAHQHLLRAPEVLAWIQEKWGFDVATVQQYGIGFMPSPILPTLAAEANRAESRTAFRASGLGFYPSDGPFITRFAGRVTFPYLEHGRAVYLIGRATPWTPVTEDGERRGKYHKLSVHSEQRPYISQRITNDHLYLEPVMDGTDFVVVAEGIADAVALSTLGVPVVSPVTVSFNKTDLERFVRKCKERNVKRVEVLFDNELSGSGNYGATRAGRQLAERGLCVSILTLPLGAKQQAARDEVIAALGQELFDELERSDPRRRKEIILQSIQDEARRAWILEQVEASKIDAAEWVAIEGAGAAGRFNSIRRAGVDVVLAEIEQAAHAVVAEASVYDRIAAFADAIKLAACIDERMMREEYARAIAKAAGKGVGKGDVASRIAVERKRVLADRKETEEEKPAHAAAEQADPLLLLLPPDGHYAQPFAAQEPQKDPSDTRPPGAPAPGSRRLASGPVSMSEHDRYAPVRDSVMKSVEKKTPEEQIGLHVAQTMTHSMGFTAFRTSDELVLVRGSERVDVGVGRATPTFCRLLYMASALTPQRASHRSYIAAVIYFLDLNSTKVHDVSWSHHDARSGSVFFPTGNASGTILRIAAGAVYRTRMSEAKVPAVAGQTFLPIEPIESCGGGINDALDALRWVSLSPSDRMLLVYWIVCLPILRKIGQIPIVRVEGGSSSGKSRTVDAVAYLVNGRKTSVVPTAAAMTSALAVEMLTIDDNRESRDMTDSLRSTLLQATGLGARQKRSMNSDTGTTTERVCGALLMNGIEPIHDGRSELASRIFTLRSDSRWRQSDSPVDDSVLFSLLLAIRNRFWSESVFRCAQALELDARWGEAIGLEIETIFGNTRIGRLSFYLRLMYLAWVANQREDRQQEFLDRIAEPWVEAFSAVGRYALQSLMHEELAVSAMRYAFAHAKGIATLPYAGADQKIAFDGRYSESVALGDARLGPLSSAQLARIVRAAGKELNAPRAIAIDLNASQLLARIQDGLGFLEDAGFRVDIAHTQSGKARFTIYRLPPERPAGDPAQQVAPVAAQAPWFGAQA